MADLKAVVAQYQELSKEWAKGGSRDLDKVGNLLEQLKLSLMKLSFLPTKGEEATIQVGFCTLRFFSSTEDPDPMLFSFLRKCGVLTLLISE